MKPKDFFLSPFTTKNAGKCLIWTLAFPIMSAEYKGTSRGAAANTEFKGHPLLSQRQKSKCSEGTWLSSGKKIHWQIKNLCFRVQSRGLHTDIILCMSVNLVIDNQKRGKSKQLPRYYINKFNLFGSLEIKLCWICLFILMAEKGTADPVHTFGFHNAFTKMPHNYLQQNLNQRVIRNKLRTG